MKFLNTLFSSKNHPTKIKGLIFTDGKINSYQEIDDTLVIQFLDYSDSNIEITFQGSVSYENNDGVGYEFADYKCSRNNSQWELQLLDDEGFCTFRVSFDEAEIKFVDDK